MKQVLGLVVTAVALFGCQKRVKEEHGGWTEPGQPNLPLEVLDRYWDEAKKR